MNSPLVQSNSEGLSPKSEQLRRAWIATTSLLTPRRGIVSLLAFKMIYELINLALLASRELGWIMPKGDSFYTKEQCLVPLTCEDGANKLESWAISLDEPLSRPMAPS